MKVIRFDNRQIQVPTSWSEIQLGQYEEWNTETDNKKNLEGIATMLNITAKEFSSYPKYIADEITNALNLISESQIEPKTNIIIGNEEFRVTQSNEITLGEWIDMEALQKENSSSYFSELLAIVCRPIGEEYDHMRTSKRAQTFSQETCDRTLPLIHFFLQQKEQIHQDFAPLFNGAGNRQAVPNSYKEFCKKWGWYKTVADLASDNILLFDQITAKKVVEVFGFLLYRVDKAQADIDLSNFSRQTKRR